MIQNIPFELLIEFFSRLSLHDISQSQLVCKDWYKPLYRLLRDLFFIDLHHLRITQENNPDFLILWVNKYSLTLESPGIRIRRKPGIYLARYDGKGFGTSIKLTETCFELEGKDFRFVGSCNGLICMALHPHCRLYCICNPLTGEMYELPEASSLLSIYIEEGDFIQDSITHGFVFDAITNTYKIIRNWKYYVGNDKYGKIGFEIYTVGSGRWRRIEDLTNYQMQFAHPISFSGALHWWSHRHGLFSPTPYILVMNTSTEIFEAFKGPPTDNPKRCYLSVLGGCLSSVVCDEENLEMWTMKNYGMENSWEMTFHISRRVRHVYQLVEGMDSGSVLFRYVDDNELYQYENGNLHCIKINGIPPCCIGDVGFHVGSLVSPIRTLKDRAIHASRSGIYGALLVE